MKDYVKEELMMLKIMFIWLHIATAIASVFGVAFIYKAFMELDISPRLSYLLIGMLSIGLSITGIMAISDWKRTGNKVV
jgi:membrane protease YdiL (CAAX protease family)